ACSAIAVVAGIATSASAGLYVSSDPSIFSPFNNAQVDVYWEYSNAGYTGELQWVYTAFESSPQGLWTNKKYNGVDGATSGQSYQLTRLFAQGERVDFSYAILKGKKDVFSTFEQADWAQFDVNAENPMDVLVRVEDIRYPGGDRDHNDAVFRVVFSQTTVPSPGAMALMGVGGVFMVRRRR
ncbi:unnamed protein product, partial [Laminaria digitata]